MTTGIQPAAGISVVILNWKRPADTIRAVESVLRQDYARLDILVWDNASGDDSVEQLTRRFAGEPRVRLHAADANYGVAGGRNRAFRETAGALILSLDSDAALEDPRALATLADRLAAAPGIGAASFEVRRPDGHLMWPFARPAAKWRSREFETMRVDGCAFAVRRDAFEQAGGFAEHFSPYGAEDQHFAFKLISDGRGVLYLPGVVVVHAFDLKGRTPLQFTMHVRNRLWIPLELFPFPQALLSFGNQLRALFADAREQGQVRDFLRGAWLAVTGFRLSRRRPMPRDRWRKFRELVAADKAARLSGPASA